ncbi:homeodomain GLABROUS 2, partial [Striga asiatica]
QSNNNNDFFNPITIFNPLPSGPTASKAFSLSRPTFSLIPSSDNTRPNTSAVLPSSPKTPPGTPTPILHVSSTILPFNLWSPKNGRHTIGTRPAMLSSIEFHPQCVTNAPTLPCPRTLGCGAHGTILPNPPAVRPTNPSGSAFLAPSLSDHRNGARRASRARARARSSGSGGTATTTDLGVSRNWSSHGRHSVGSAVVSLGDVRRVVGPTLRKWRNLRRRSAVMAGSISSKELRTIAEDFGRFRTMLPMVRARGDGLSTSRKISGGRSARRAFSSPGMK